MTVKEFLRMADSNTMVEIETYEEVAESFYDAYLGDLIWQRTSKVTYHRVSKEEFIEMNGDKKFVGFWAIAENVIGICLE